MVALCLRAATADAAYLRKGKPSRRLDDVDCSDDPEWYHKNRVSLVLNLATNADGEEDPQPIFDYAATGACAAVDE